MDISDTLAPKSDQLDAIDLLSGPRVFTVTDVTKGSAEQPVQIHLAEFSRPWRPGVTMRRLIFKMWGGQGREYVGRRVELYNDETVTFGNDRTGGIRIRSMSHIGNQARTETLPISRGKYGKFTVQPLPDAAPEPTTADRIASLRAEWAGADEDRRKVIAAEVEALQGGAS
jgi:hypothetical protein